MSPGEMALTVTISCLDISSTFLCSILCNICGLIINFQPAKRDLSSSNLHLLFHTDTQISVASLFFCSLLIPLPSLSNQTWLLHMRTTTSLAVVPTILTLQSCSASGREFNITLLLNLFPMYISHLTHLTMHISCIIGLLNWSTFSLIFLSPKSLFSRL